VKTDLGSE